MCRPRPMWDRPKTRPLSRPTPYYRRFPYMIAFTLGRGPYARRQKAALLLMVLALVATTALPAFPTLALAGGIGDRQSMGYLSGGIARMNYRFVVATDSHLGSWQGNTKTKSAFSDMVQHAKDASFMVHMGDITETGALSSTTSSTSTLRSCPSRRTRPWETTRQGGRTQPGPFRVPPWRRQLLV